MKSKELFFFIGTEAELIKVFTVIIECQQKGCICHIIASGQNDLGRSRILPIIELNGQYIELGKEEDIIKSTAGLLKWFILTKASARKIIQKRMDIKSMKHAPLIVHGDTISTLMGAILGKELGMRVCHIEAGLRSHNYFNPFPEEIDRVLTSKIARFHFAPSEEAVKNLERARGTVVCTKYNTILDSLQYSLKMDIVSTEIQKLTGKDFFVFVMHRQENLMNNEFVRAVLKEIIKLAEQKQCVLILHKITENKLREMGVLAKLKSNRQFILLPRVDYFDFMKLLNQAKYVITDGGSNQEELAYMGKPCLIMRKETERQDGIGNNAVLFGGKVKNIAIFAKNYRKYSKEAIVPEKSPSNIIAGKLERMLCEESI